MQTRLKRAVLTGLTTFALACAVHAQAPTPPTTIADTDPGWIWDHMFKCDPTGSAIAGAHAGGQGSSGTYIFSGTGMSVYGTSDATISVSNAVHRLGKIRITLDGVRIGDFAEPVHGQSADTPLLSVHNLVNKPHALIVEPIDGWASVSTVQVEHTAPKMETASVVLLTGKKSIPPGVYKICPKIAPNLGLDVIGAFRADGTGLQLFTYVQQSNQQFRLTNSGSGQYVLQPLIAPYSAISVLPATADAPMRLGIWQYVANAAQVWVLSETPRGYCRLSPSNLPGQALTDAAVQNGLALAPVDNSDDQDWEIIPAVQGK